MLITIRVYEAAPGRIRITAEGTVGRKRVVTHWRNVDVHGYVHLDEQGFYLMLNALEGEIKGWLF